MQYIKKQALGRSCVMLMALFVLGCSDSGSDEAGPIHVAPEQITLESSCSSVEAAGISAVVSEVPVACQVDSWLSGGSEYCRGRHIYRDYVYDDYGADIASSQGKAGDATYPPGQENTADLVNLQLWVAGQRLYVRGELNTLFDEDSTILAIAIDTDNNPETGGGEWCDIGTSSQGWEVLQAFRSGDVERNVIEGSIPLPPGDQWRVYAVTAQSDGTVMNVAYRGIDESVACTSAEPSCFYEGHQAVALAEGDISSFGADISVAQMQNGIIMRPPSITPGIHSRVYTSEFTIPPGEGLGRVPGRGTGGLLPLASQHFDYLGKYQPYGIYFPSTAEKPYPLQFIFHGTGGNHSSASAPGAQQQYGENLGRILVAPLARGPDGYGSDISEADILEVYRDMVSTYDIDLDRVISSGYSQGGYVAFRMASLYPQLFAGFITWVGFTGDDLNGTVEPLGLHITAGAVGNMRDFVGNLLNMPGVMMYGGIDIVVQPPSALNMQQAFNATDNIYRWYLYPTADHTAYGALDDWRNDAEYSADFRRVNNPPRVVFRHDPTLGNEHYGIAHDRAYWISDIHNREVGADHLAEIYGDIDLTNHSCGGEIPVGTYREDLGQDPIPWYSRERARTGVTEIPVDNLLEGSVSNIASLTVDAEQTCNKRHSLKYRISTDGPTEIHLSDGRTIILPEAGTHEGVI